MTFQFNINDEARSLKKFSIIITVIFFVISGSVAFLVDNPTADSDLLFYYYSGQQIISGDGENVQIFNAPVGWPILLASFDTIIGDPFTTGKIFSLIFSTGIVFISYFIIRNVFGQKIALLGQTIIAVSPLLHVESIITHSEMLPVFLIFISFYFITKKKLSQKHIILCGISLGLSFMLRPQSLFIGFGILIFILSSIKKEKKRFVFYLIVSFLIIISPLLLYNIATTGNILDTTPDFYVTYDSSTSDHISKESSRENILNESGIIDSIFNFKNISKNYFENLLYANPHLFLNLGSGYNNFSTIPFIPFNGIIFVLGGMFGILVHYLTKKYILALCGLSLSLAIFLIITNMIHIYFLLPIILPLVIMGIFTFKKINSNVRPLLIIPLFFLLPISIVSISGAQDLFAILIIPATFSAYFILNIIPKIIIKIQNCLKIDSNKITNLSLAVIIFMIISCNLVSSFMIEEHILFGIPVDYHNLLSIDKNHELKALEYKEIGEILSTEPDIQNKIIMANSVNYAHYAKSKFMFTNFSEGKDSDSVYSFIFRENWSDYDTKLSNVLSIPRDRYGLDEHIPDYLIYSINSENNKNLQILNNHNNPKIPKNFELFYISNNGGTMIYKINHDAI